LGRAYLHVKENGDKCFEGILLNALKNNLVYDNQSEGGRADWLFSIIELTNRAQFYEEELLKTVDAVNYDWDLDQLFDLLAEFAKRGSIRSKKALYVTFDSQRCEESWIGGEQIVDVDGIEGFIHVAEIIGKRLIEDERYWESDSMLQDVKERFGAEALEAALEKGKKDSENIRAYFAGIKPWNRGGEETKAQRFERFRKEYPLEKLLAELGKEEPRFPFGPFGYYATDEDASYCFEMLRREANKMKVYGLLRVFGRRQLPGYFEGLNGFALDDDEHIRDAAVTALSHLRHGGVRKTAFDLLNENKWQKRLSALPLFLNNYQPGDHRVIEKVLEMIPMDCDRDTMHGLVSDLVHLCEKNNSPEMKRLLLWVYGNSPCMNCRCKAVKLMLEAEELPDDILDECVYDGYAEIREMARKAKSF
jgi:hypothetical protein